MSNLRALGFFIDYCNKHWTKDREDDFQYGMRTILHSIEGRFYDCNSPIDIIIEIGLEP